MQHASPNQRGRFNDVPKSVPGGYRRKNRNHLKSQKRSRVKVPDKFFRITPS